MNLCPYCNQSSTLKFHANDSNRRISQAKFEYRECNSCGLIFLRSIPSNLSEYYPESYYELPSTQEELDRRSRKFQGWKLDALKNHKQGGSLLEIGPAYGLFAHLAKNAGFDVTVIEMDKRCCSFLRDTVKVKVIEGDVSSEVLATLPRFDVIAMWQVIEHLPEPWKLLPLLLEKLSPGGLLILDTPNPESLQFRLLGRYWAHLDAPRHTCLLPSKWLSNVGNSLGFHVCELNMADRGAKGWNSFGWAHSLRNLSSQQQLASVLHFVGRVIAKLMIPIERLGKLGSSYTAVLRKEGK